MYQEQRFEKILDLLDERGNLSVKEMVDALGVSKDTVRRDFDCLSQRNLAQRTHGGILPVKNTTVLGFQERQKGLTEDKKKMADLALSFVKDQSLLFFGKEGVDFHLLGGRFYSKNRFYYSLHEAQLLQHLRFDLAFFGAASLSQGVVSYEDEEDVAVKQLAMQAARTKILIAEVDKYEKHSKYILGKIEDFDYWITDKKPEPDLVEALKDKVTILYDGKESNYE
ncbi:MAG: DeoR/GlpR family DNA-binding transcription regulator [Streptococcus sp.]|uniref:DeoR/GlpR family DNA-binding transcription regulator n=1 Tax=Streptococcus sp. TaxID=1306 RepID=UPI002900CA44|nr:DeoR/GlpR family DNA-binding transcription regulator [Streptococcus sp.]MDU3069647.1 DeoR/GlpR family DNA-binding transcription regulator [Streptococcus sp.]